MAARVGEGAVATSATVDGVQPGRDDAEIVQGGHPQEPARLAGATCFAVRQLVVSGGNGKVLLSTTSTPC